MVRSAADKPFISLLLPFPLLHRCLCRPCQHMRPHRRIIQLAMVVRFFPRQLLLYTLLLRSSKLALLRHCLLLITTSCRRQLRLCMVLLLRQSHLQPAATCLLQLHLYLLTFLLTLVYFLRRRRHQQLLFTFCQKVASFPQLLRRHHFLLPMHFLTRVPLYFQHSFLLYY